MKKPEQPKKSLQELYEILKPYSKYKGRLIRHIKSDTIYYVSEVNFRESDLSIWFTYEPFGYHSVPFSRPIEELLDGRYEL